MEQIGRKIIYVEDDDLVRDVVQVLIDESPHRIVRHAVTRPAALAAISAVASGQLEADTVVLPDRLEADDEPGAGPLEIVEAIRKAQLNMAVVGFSTVPFANSMPGLSAELPRVDMLDIVPTLDELGKV